MKIELLNGANLAFIGDAYFELVIREHLIRKGITNQKELHTKCVDYVSADAHYKIYKKMEEENFLTSDEMVIFKRGRNHEYKPVRKNLDIFHHLISSGLEAVIGYLYLQKDIKRLNEVIDFAIKVVEEKDE